MCYEGLEAGTPQVRRNAIRESIEEIIGTKDTNEKSNHNQDTALNQLENLNNSYNAQFRLCYDALAEDTPQAKRDDLRNAIAGFLNKKTGG